MNFKITKKPIKETIALLTILVSVCFFNITHSAEAFIKILDVGQGDSILIQTKTHKNILIDTGIDQQVIHKLSEELFFFRPTIDLLVITHADLDHYGGSFEILEKYTVKKVMISGVANHQFLFNELIKTLQKKNIPLIIATNETDIKIDHQLFLDIIIPGKKRSLIGQEIKNKNNHSIATTLIYKSTNGNQKTLALLTGDAEKEQEINLIKSGYHLHAPLLKIGHHGSQTSSSDVFLDIVQPKIAVISAGKDNAFGHPHPSVIEKLTKRSIKTFNTAKSGTIAIPLNMLK